MDAMPRCRPQFTVRRLIIAVAVVALAVMVARWTRDRCLESGQTTEVLVTVVVGGVTGFGALRFPLIFLILGFVVGFIPQYAAHSHYFDTQAAMTTGFVVGAFTGAPVGLLTRFLKFPVPSHAAKTSSPETDELG